MNTSNVLSEYDSLVFPGIAIAKSKNFCGFPYQHHFVAMGSPVEDPVSGETAVLNGEDYILMGIQFFDGIANSVTIKLDYLYTTSWCHCTEWCTIPGIAFPEDTYQKVVASFKQEYQRLLENGHDKPFEDVMDILMDNTNLINILM